MQTPPVDYARDMFLMSFYLRGMSFIDMAFLKKPTSATATLPTAPEDRPTPHDTMD